MSLTLQRVTTPEQLESFATMMLSTEPWITIRRTQEETVKLLANPISINYAVVVDGETVGYTRITLQGAFVGYINTLVIGQQWQGRGYGSQVIKELENIIFAQFPNVFIMASSFNPRAVKLYQSLGYEVIGELKDYAVKGHSEILLRKTIGPIIGFKPKAK
ncbi:MAG TPA: GNAT family N-acetyltransferase [Bacteroidia bacterium]|nr:GNAT family N-acetyltransferase [Bacteroidia bacterium]